MVRTLVVTALFTVPAMLAAQTNNPSGCTQIDRAIVLSEKAMSHIWAEGIVDNNVSREALREQQVANELQIVAANLQISAQLKCAPRAEPISRNAYLEAALICVGAERRQVPVNNAPPLECDRETWKRGPGK
jgi:hypothetical protein